MSCSRSTVEEAKRLGASSHDRMTSVTSESNVPPSGFDPEGRSSGDAACASNDDSGSASPNFLKWAESLHLLLNDPTGLELFQEYLEQEDPDRFHMLKFWLACRGVPKQPSQDTAQYIKVIYKQLFLKIQQGINEELRKKVTQQIREAMKNEEALTVSVFNEPCKIVENVMNKVMYPNFLGSETYLNYVQKMQADMCNVDNNSREAPALPEEDELPIFSQPLPLPVVSEDKELTLDFHHTRKHRSQFPRSSLDPYSTRLSMQQCGSASHVNQHRRLYHYSYNPVSRQDSELQSLSSDARTDSMSDLTLYSVPDLSDHVGKNWETYAQKRHMQKQMRLMKENASLNQNPDGFKQIPRTSNPQVIENAKPQNPKQFASLLIEKLEKVKKEIESKELVVQKLSSINCTENENVCRISQQTLSDTSFLKPDEDDQDILDKHVSRIWSDQTPKWSPGFVTPVRPKSPDGRKFWPAHISPNKVSSHLTNAGNRLPGAHMSSHNTKRKDKYAYSLFSTDSGNGTDPAECSDYHHRKLNKGHPLRNSSRALSGSRRTVTTDSGVSMISGEEVHKPPHNKDKKIQSWLSMSKSPALIGAPENSCSSVMGEDNFLSCSSSTVKANSILSGYSHSSGRSRTVDRSVGSSKNIEPGQPFVADPSMPPFSFHSINPDIVVEELQRRLVQMEPKQNQNFFDSKNNVNTPESRISTRPYEFSQYSDSLKTANVPQRPSTLNRSSQNYTSVVCNFSDESVPYLLKVPGNPITLKMFKDHMPPKKGNYRYFFKTTYEDLDNTPIQEEITDDNQFLPLWKGKVNAQIKAIE